MAYVARAHVNPGDLGESADQNQGMDNEAWLYDNLRTEMKAYHAHIPSAAVGADSDEFDSTTLNVAWTAYGGLASGTISEFETGAVDKYDLASWPGWLAMQSDNDVNSAAMTDFGVRKSFAPGTGPWAVIARVAYLGLTDTGKYNYVGVQVSDNTTPTNYTNLRFGMRATTNNIAAVFTNQAGAIATLDCNFPGSAAYLAMVRLSAGGNTVAYYSKDGLAWEYIGVTATATSVSYLWIGVQQDVPTNRPVYLCDFVRTFATATLACGRAGNS